MNSAWRMTYGASHHVKHQRRVFNLEQGCRVVRTANRRNGAVVCTCQPVKRGLQQIGQFGRLGGDDADQFVAAQLAQRGWALPKHGLSRPKGGKQFASRVVADARAQRQAQPGFEFSALQG